MYKRVLATPCGDWGEVAALTAFKTTQDVYLDVWWMSVRLIDSRWERPRLLGDKGCCSNSPSRTPPGGQHRATHTHTSRFSVKYLTSQAEFNITLMTSLWHQGEKLPQSISRRYTTVFTGWAVLCLTSKLTFMSKKRWIDPLISTAVRALKM